MKQRHLLYGLLFCCLGFLVFACGNQPNNSEESKAIKDSLEAVQVLNIVSQIPEVTDRKKLIEGNSEGNKQLSTWIDEKPGKQPFYKVAVGEKAGKTETGLHFNFHVYPESMRIVFYDELNQREIPLEEWREQNK